MVQDFSMGIPEFDEEIFKKVSVGCSPESVDLAERILRRAAELDRTPEADRGEWYKRTVMQTIGRPQPSLESIEQLDAIKERYYRSVGWPRVRERT